MWLSSYVNYLLELRVTENSECPVRKERYLKLSSCRGTRCLCSPGGPLARGPFALCSAWLTWRLGGCVGWHVPLGWAALAEKHGAAGAGLAALRSQTLCLRSPLPQQPVKGKKKKKILKTVMFGVVKHVRVITSSTLLGGLVFVKPVILLCSTLP